MTVIIANDTPPAIRGMLKRWFIEPKPNVFVGSVNPRTREKTLEYIRRNAPALGLLVIGDENTSQGFSVTVFGETDRRPVVVCGHHLIAEKWDDSDQGEASC
jgi:CRISPR-associated protein Cas2